MSIKANKINNKMGSKERILRLKENTRSNLLKAALKIVKKNGWQALSMRKIADEIDYTAPVIYEYFSNKESLISELSASGYQMLSLKIKSAMQSHAGPVEQLEAMWLAYWYFAFSEKELYQAMYGVEVNCSLMKEGFSKAEEIKSLFSGVIAKMTGEQDNADEIIATKYFMLWSAVHGLISINMVNRGQSEEINQRVLQETIQGTIRSITRSSGQGI
jgi:AcrR family transcriptional regulator